MYVTHKFNCQSTVNVCHFGYGLTSSTVNQQRMSVTWIWSHKFNCQSTANVCHLDMVSQVQLSINSECLSLGYGLTSSTVNQQRMSVTWIWSHKFNCQSTANVCHLDMVSQVQLSINSECQSLGYGLTCSTVNHQLLSGQKLTSAKLLTSPTINVRA